MDFKKALREKGFRSDYIEIVEDEIMMRVAHIDNVAEYVNGAPKIVQNKVIEEINRANNKEKLDIYLSKLAEGLQNVNF